MDKPERWTTHSQMSTPGRYLESITALPRDVTYPHHPRLTACGLGG